MTQTTNNTKKVAKSSITVITSLYWREYQREPKGRGSWAFSIGDKSGYDDALKAFFTNSMTYKEAVKVAKEEAQKRGTDIIYVLP